MSQLLHRLGNREEARKFLVSIIGNDTRFLVFVILFILVFKLVFHPFGRTGLPWPHIVIPPLLLIGVFSLVFLTFKTRMHRYRWQWALATILTTGILSKFLHWSLGLAEVSWTNFFSWVYATGVVLSIPFVLRGVLDYLTPRDWIKAQVAKKNAFEYSAEIPELNTLELDTLLYIQSTENYLTFNLIEDGKINRVMIRGSMGAIEPLSASKYLTRCHRSYMINLYHVNALDGNKRKASATIISGSEKILVPVSIRRFEELKHLWRSIS